MAATFPEQYAELRAEGLPPSKAAVALCQANRDRMDWVVKWLSKENSETAAFLHSRWEKLARAEARSWSISVGYLESGCYYYGNYLGRPVRTGFIRWQEIASIYVQDGLDMLALCIYSHPQKYGAKHLQSQSNRPGFESFVQEVSRRFFGDPHYLGTKFRPGAHPVRKLRVWPDECEV